MSRILEAWGSACEQGQCGDAHDPKNAVELFWDRAERRQLALLMVFQVGPTGSWSWEELGSVDKNCIVSDHPVRT